jgi:hypothetical protein
VFLDFTIWVSLKTQQVAAAVSLFFSIGHCFYEETPKTRLAQQTLNLLGAGIFRGDQRVYEY